MFTLKNNLVFILVICFNVTDCLNNLHQIPCNHYAWQAICDFSYREGKFATNNGKLPSSPADVRPGSTVFLTYDSADVFFPNIHNQIKVPYILVEALWNPGTRNHLDDETIIACFTTDPGPTKTRMALETYDFSKKIEHPKIKLIPIGILKAQNPLNHPNMYQLFNRLQNKPKNQLLHMCFTLHPWHPLRHEVYKMLQNESWVTNKCHQKKPFYQYLEEMSNYKFTISPEGDNNECYRHWEAMLCGVIPIIQRTSMDDIFEGLPVLLIDHWGEITPEFLQKKYAEIKSKKYNLEKLYLQYWVNQINQIKHIFFNQQ